MLELVLSDEITEIKLARWTDRFLAWLIDFVIISIISTTILAAATGNFEIIIVEDDIWSESINYIPGSLVFFAYWTITEYKMGQSIGKRVFHLKTVSMDGKAADLKGVMISSFGKAFLLPFDVVFGWIFTNKNRQRIFNRAGDTIVVKSQNQDVIEYKKD